MRLTITLALAVSLLGSASRAAPQLRLVPGVSVGGGYDDDVLFDNQGGDQVGRTSAMLLAHAFDRLWSFNADLQATGLGYRERGRGVLLGEATVGASDRVSRLTRLFVHARLRAADDPLALAQVGLLAGEGRTLGYRSSAGVESRLTRDWSLVSELTFDGVSFLDRSTEPDGQAAGVVVSPQRRLSRELALTPSVEGRLFLTRTGVVARTVGALPGMRLRLARRTFLEAAAGGLAYDDAAGLIFLPVARLKATYEWRHAQAELDAAHDLTVPSGRGGVLSGELVEAAGRYGDGAWELRARGGFYRSHPTPRLADWVPGYGLTVGAYRSLGAGVWLGGMALRFTRLATQTEPELSRDAFYLQLVWTKGRP